MFLIEIYIYIHTWQALYVLNVTHTMSCDDCTSKVTFNWILHIYILCDLKSQHHKLRQPCVFLSISMRPPRISDPLVKVNSTYCLTESYWVSALFTRCPGDTVQTGTGKVDPDRKFKYTKSARASPLMQTNLPRGGGGRGL